MSAAHVAKHKIVILVVDDDSAVRRALKFSLEVEGFTVHTCRDGEDLLAHPALKSSDCIVLDYKMPGMDGLTVLEKLGAAKIDTPVIFISGPVSRNLREQAMKAGARLVLEKPLFDKSLLEKIHEVTN
jgi:FixJ family two-component response regulator